MYAFNLISQFLIVVALSLVFVHLLEFRVEIFASLQGGSQYCSLWVDPHVLLRPA